jgi:hypothetical protein
LPPGEIQRLFDAYVIMQAQQVLQLDDARFGQFVQRLKALQEVRRKGEMERHKLVQQLARLTAPGQTTDDAQLRDALKALHEQESRTAAQIRQAYDALDEALDLRQQARFRVFEQQMERRKIDLLLRARGGEAGPMKRIQ